MPFRMAAPVETRARTRLPSIIFISSQGNQFFGSPLLILRLHEGTEKRSDIRYPVVTGILIIPDCSRTVHLDGGLNRSGEPDIPGENGPVISEDLVTGDLLSR
jgi:hypothetical protein